MTTTLVKPSVSPCSVVVSESRAIHAVRQGVPTPIELGGTKASAPCGHAPQQPPIHHGPNAELIVVPEKVGPASKPQKWGFFPLPTGTRYSYLLFYDPQNQTQIGLSMRRCIVFDAVSRIRGDIPRGLEGRGR